METYENDKYMIYVRKLLNHVLLIENRIFNQKFRSIVRVFGNFQIFDVISKNRNSQNLTFISWKNFSIYLLSYHVLLIQNRQICEIL